MKKDRRVGFGFTVVELLIVIVVIAVLATITVIAYNGITKQAQSAAYAAAADAVEKQIRVATVMKSPDDLFNDSVTHVGVPSCWGSLDDYPSTPDFAAGECYTAANGAFRYSVNPTIMNQIKAVNSGLALPSGLATVNFSLFGDKARGIVFNYVSYSNTMNLFWLSPEPTGCGRGETTSIDAIFRPAAEIYQEALGVLYKSRDGTISLLQAQTELEQLFGGPLGEQLTPDLVTSYISMLESLTAAWAPYLADHSSICQLEINLQ